VNLMKRIFGMIGLFLSLCAPATVMAQSASLNHVEIGGFADYFRLDETSPAINFVGLGGRLAVNVHRNVQLEGEMSYDFKRTFVSVFSNGVNTQLVSTDLRPLTALVGPKFQTSGPVRAFITGKVGFINFTTSNQSASTGFKSAIGAVTSGDTRVAFYPGGGIEGFWGPIGLRLEAGDEIYFDGGARNNLKVSFGPTFRF
jgi:opacity protein-like surface antigen